MLAVKQAVLLISFPSLFSADGIALGAAATNRLDVEVVIFFAIMLHKVS